MTATTADESAPTETGGPIEKRRPPLVKSVPFIGPVRQFLGDVLPFLMDSRATYGDAFGHAPPWVLRNPVYRSVQKQMRSHFLDLVARIRSSPERAATLVGRYLDLDPPIGRERWEDRDPSRSPKACA